MAGLEIFLSGSGWGFGLRRNRCLRVVLLVFARACVAMQNSCGFSFGFFIFK
jgi:hypothetical protein